MHHEVELGVIIGRTASKVNVENAMDYVGGYVLALDMTSRDFQVRLPCHIYVCALSQSAKISSVKVCKEELMRYRGAPLGKPHFPYSFYFSRSRVGL